MQSLMLTLAKIQKCARTEQMNMLKDLLLITDADSSKDVEIFCKEACSLTFVEQRKLRMVFAVLGFCQNPVQVKVFKSCSRELHLV